MLVFAVALLGSELRVQLDGEARRRDAERLAGGAYDFVAEHPVACPADDGADAERHQAPDGARRLADDEPLQEHRLDAPGQLADEGAREALGHHFAPEDLLRRAFSEGLARELLDEVLACLAEHERLDERACAHGVGDGEAVDFSDGLPEE